MIDGVDKEVRVFKEAEDSEVKYNSRNQKRKGFLLNPEFTYKNVQTVVYENAYYYNKEITVVKIPVEPKWHSEKKELGRNEELYTV